MLLVRSSSTLKYAGIYSFPRAVETCFCYIRLEIELNKMHTNSFLITAIHHGQKYYFSFFADLLKYFCSAFFTKVRLVS